MKNQTRASLVLVTLLVVGSFFGCAKKSDNNTNNGFGYPPGYTGTVMPGGLLASAVATSHITGLNVDFELYFKAGISGTASDATVEGIMRMSQSDIVCQVNVPPLAILPIVPEQSRVTINGTGNVQTVSGKLVVQIPNGLLLEIQFYNVQLHMRASLGPAIGAITGGQFPYYLTGSTIIQSGQCAGQPNAGWPLQQI